MNPKQSSPRFVSRVTLGIGGVVAILALATVVAVSVFRAPAARAGGSGVACLPTSGPVCTFKFRAGTAFFESASRCLTIDVQVFAFENFTRSGAGGVTDEPSLQIQDYGTNSCDGSSFSGSGALFGGDLQVQASNNGDTLIAQGNVPVTNTYGDGSTASATYAVTLTWLAAGQASPTTQTFHFRSPYFQIEGHFTGTSVPADVTGSISDGANSYAQTTSPYSPTLLDAASGTYVMLSRS